MEPVCEYCYEQPALENLVLNIWVEKVGRYTFRFCSEDHRDTFEEQVEQ